jgi:hypothetical protein
LRERLSCFQPSVLTVFCFVSGKKAAILNWTVAGFRGLGGLPFSRTKTDLTAVARFSL